MRRVQTCLQQAHFDWVTEAGMKEQLIVMRQHGLCCFSRVVILGE